MLLLCSAQSFWPLSGCISAHFRSIMDSSVISFPSDFAAFILPAQSIPTRRLIALAYSEGAGWDSLESCAATHGPKEGMTQSYHHGKQNVNKEPYLNQIQEGHLVPGHHISGFTFPTEPVRKVFCVRRGEGVSPSMMHSYYKPGDSKCEACCHSSQCSSQASN